MNNVMIYTKKKIMPLTNFSAQENNDILVHRHSPPTIRYWKRIYVLKQVINTHPSLIIRPWFWMKSIASSGLLNISIRTMSSRGNAVDRGPTVCARFNVCKAFALTCIGCTYTKLLMILLLRGFKVHGNIWKQLLTWLKYRCKRQLTRYDALFTNLKKRTKLLLLTAANAWTANLTSGELRTSARNCCTSLFDIWNILT